MNNPVELLQYKVALRDIRFVLAEYLGVSSNLTPEETVEQVTKVLQEVAKWKAEADKVSEMGEEAINGWQEIDSFSWGLVQMVHSCNLRYGG
jgi:hypothetical protein